MPDTEDGVTGGPVELVLGEDLTVYLKFNMLSNKAQLKEFGRVSGIWNLFGPPPPQPLPENPTKEAQQAWEKARAAIEAFDVLDAMYFLLGAACLHKHSGIEVDYKGLLDQVLHPHEAAARAGRLLMQETEGVEDQPILDALAEASDISYKIKPCACEHRYGRHHFTGACMDCGCPFWHVEPRLCARCKVELSVHGLGEHDTCPEFEAEAEEPEGKGDAPDGTIPMPTPTPGAASTTSPPSDSDEAVASSG